MAKVDPRGLLSGVLAECYDDFDLFNSAILQRPPYWKRQREICRSITDYHQTLVCTGNMVGKDYVVGGVVPAWLFTRPNSLVIVTGPSQTTIGSITWKEIKRALAACPFPHKAKLSSGIKSSPQFMRLNDMGWHALGYSTTSVERASGQHAGELLVVVEEASGVEEQVWEALDGLGYSRLLAIFNPIRATGEVVKRWRIGERDAKEGKPAAESINCIRVPSTESPHAHLERSPFGMADRTWLRSVERRYGKDSLWYRSHVQAEIPSDDTETLLPEAWLDRCTSFQRPADAPFSTISRTRRIACDLGEGVGRDLTVVLCRDDNGILEVQAGNTKGLAEAAGIIARMKATWSVPDERITFDRLGTGRDLPMHLQRHGVKQAIGYHSNGVASNAVEFHDVRSEAAWNFRRRIDPEWQTVGNPPFHIPPAAWWGAMREELVVLTYDLIGKQTRLMLKKHWSEILGHSPDYGDALIQSFANLNTR